MTNLTAPIFQVSELVQYLDLIVSQQSIQAEGEITEFNINKGRMVFITLSDKMSNVQLFGLTHELSNLSQLTVGMKVLVSGTPGFFKTSGKFRLYIQQIAPQGEGALRIAFENLKAKLDKEGLFDPARKRTITRFPQRIALLTAKDSRAYGDFITLLNARFGGIKIDFYPVAVQGTMAVSQIVNTLYHLKNISYDAVVLVRGGGGLEDLAAFNSEEIVRAIFACSFPVLVGIGHEDDITLADLVADIRASTPTNAAEKLVKLKSQWIAEVDQILWFLSESTNQKISSYTHALRLNNERLSNRFRSFPMQLKNLNQQILQYLVNIQEKVSDHQQTVQSGLAQIQTQLTNHLSKQTDRLSSLNRLLQSLDIRHTLDRGFAIAYTQNGQIIRTPKSIKSKEPFTLQVEKGFLKARKE